MKKYFLSFALAVLMCAGVCSCSGTEPLEIMSFNIRMSGAAEEDGENRWENRRQAVVDMLSDESPALIGMQEVLPDQLTYLDSALSQSYRRIGVGREDGIAAGETMAIYYCENRVEMQDWGTFWLSDTPDIPSMGWDAACHRTATWILFRDRETGKEYCYVNTHFDHVGQVARTMSSELICDKVKEIVTDGRPVVLGGDFNSSEDDPALSALYDCFVYAGDTVPTYNGYGKADPPVKIDHFFVKGLKKISVRTLDGDYGIPYISDHYPVVITF